MEVILLERVAKLGHMGDTVRVKDGYARNFLLPRRKALRATEANKKKFEEQRADLEERNHEMKPDASEQVDQGRRGDATSSSVRPGETGQLYGSVSARDIAERADGRRSTRSTATMSRSISRSSRSACTRFPSTCIPRSRRM